MMKRTLFFLPVMVFMLLIALFAVKLVHPTPVVPLSPLLYKTFPAIHLSSLFPEQGALTNSAFAGRPVLVNVFASWCISCNAEHATLVKLAKTHQLPIYGLNWKDKDENAKAWLEKHGNPYTQIGKDPDGRVAVELGITGAPESWLVDKNGIIIYHLAGGLTDQIVQEEVLPLLAGNRQ